MNSVVDLKCRLTCRTGEGLQPVALRRAAIRPTLQRCVTVAAGIESRENYAISTKGFDIFPNRDSRQRGQGDLSQFVTLTLGINHPQIDIRRLSLVVAVHDNAIPAGGVYAPIA